MLVILRFQQMRLSNSTSTILLFSLIQGLLWSPKLTFAQGGGVVKRMYHRVFNDTSAAQNPKFIAYPTVAYAPETKWEIGLSAIYVYYAGRDTLNRLSEVTAFAFVTQESQYGLWMDHALYTDKSEWFFLGRARFQQFPLLYFGNGPQVTGEELAQIDAGSITIRERILRQVRGPLYLGLESDFQLLSNVTYEPISANSFPVPKGLDSYLNLGLGLGLVYDNRHNVLNVRKGFFAESGFLNYSEALGSDFSFTNYFLDLRYYKSVASTQVLASQLYFTHIHGTAPFNQLSLMGGETIMRGYYLGRYRDQTLIAGQTEYRFLPFPFSERWGAAAFLSAGTVADAPKSIDFTYLKVAGGAGIRFLLFRSKDIFTRFDVAFTEDGAGYYFFIGEAF